jgi:hypothetical protein
MKMISLPRKALLGAFAAFLVVAAASTPSANASQVCMNTSNGQGGNIKYYPYLFNNNTFNWSYDKSGSSECLSLNYTSESNGVYYDGFSSTYNWPYNSGTQYDVKAFPSMVYGWQYGYTYSGLGLPSIIYNNKNVPTYQSVSLSNPSYEDVLIDNWLLSSPNASQQSDELEIFTSDDWNAYSQASNGSHLGYITLDNQYYVVSHGYVNSGSYGWNVYNFFPNVNSNNFNASPNIKDFANALCYDYGVIPNNLYIGGTQIGLETYYGNGSVTFNPAAVSVN